jgi:uncharacterized membrane protein YidH (DUF202 family)
MKPANDQAGVTPADDMEDTDPGLARERTSLAWTRTAISFAALGGAIVKTTPPAGVLILAMSALIWGAGRMQHRRKRPGTGDGRRLLLITLAVSVVALAALAVALPTGSGPLPVR